MTKLVEKASYLMDIVARAAVAAIMFATTLNVILRRLAHPSKALLKLSNT